MSVDVPLDGSTPESVGETTLCSELEIVLLPSGTTTPRATLPHLLRALVVWGRDRAEEEARVWSRTVQVLQWVHGACAQEAGGDYEDGGGHLLPAGRDYCSDLRWRECHVFHSPHSVFWV